MIKIINTYGKQIEFIKGDANNPESEKNNITEYIQKSDGIIHTVGQLIASSESEYNQVNYESAINMANLVDKIDLDKSNNLKKNFVFISAERGLMFPLSLKFSGYIDAKRKAEEALLTNYKNIIPIILRPGLIEDTTERPILTPVSMAFNAVNYLEKNVLNKVLPQIGEKVSLPAASISLDVLAMYAAAGAIGRFSKNAVVYGNDYMNDMDNLKKVDIN